MADTAKSLPALVCNSAALRGASRRITQLYDGVLAPSGLRTTQYAILNDVDRHGPLSLNDLARRLLLDRSTLGHNLRPLERDRLLELTVDEDDRRSRLIALTQGGQTKLRELRPLWATAQARFEAAFGVEQARRLRELSASLGSDEFVEAFGRG